MPAPARALPAGLEGEPDSEREGQHEDHRHRQQAQQRHHRHPTRRHPLECECPAADAPPVEPVGELAAEIDSTNDGPRETSESAPTIPGEWVK